MGREEEQDGSQDKSGVREEISTMLIDTIVWFNSVKCLGVVVYCIVTFKHFLVINYGLKNKQKLLNLLTVTKIHYYIDT